MNLYKELNKTIDNLDLKIELQLTFRRIFNIINNNYINYTDDIISKIIYILYNFDVNDINKNLLMKELNNVNDVLKILYNNNKKIWVYDNKLVIKKDKVNISKDQLLKVSLIIKNFKINLKIISMQLYIDITNIIYSFNPSKYFINSNFKVDFYYIEFLYINFKDDKLLNELLYEFNIKLYNKNIISIDKLQLLINEDFINYKKDELKDKDLIIIKRNMFKSINIELMLKYKSMIYFTKDIIENDMLENYIITNDKHDCLIVVD